MKLRTEWEGLLAVPQEFIARSLIVPPALTALLVGGTPVVPERSQQPYRFVLDSEGPRPVEFRGLITVDGESRAIDPSRTPFEFACEAGSMITGYFEVMSEDGKLRLRVFDPGYSHRRAAAVARRARVIRFSWARPGIAPLSRRRSRKRGVP